MRILVCGVSGFVGKHLVNALLESGHDVLGTGLDSDIAPEIRSLLTTYYGGCDLTKPADVSTLPLDNVDAIINLAGLAQVGSSFDAAEKYQSINVGVHTALTDELLKRGLKSVRVIAISTGAVYDSSQSMPLTENSTLISNGSPYAMSKIAMEQAMMQQRNRGLDVIIVRPFNHIGPGQLPGFLVPDLVKQLRSEDQIIVGNLSTERDYTDVRDVVQAYTLIATTPQLPNHVYNVCTGTSISGATILNLLVRALGKEDVSIEVDPDLIRPNDPEKIFGSYQRLRNDTGWQPVIPVTDTIRDIISA